MIDHRDIERFFRKSIETKEELISQPDIIGSIADLALAALETVKSGHKVIFCGNGGSFADAQHLATEFISRFMIDRMPLPALALGTNSSNLSAIANDYGYEQVFARELSVMGHKDDLFIPISTSGRSPSVLEAVRVSQKMGIRCVALTGSSQSPLSTLCTCIQVPSDVTAHIQECHITIGHFICKFVEENYF